MGRDRPCCSHLNAVHCVTTNLTLGNPCMTCVVRQGEPTFGDFEIWTQLAA